LSGVATITKDTTGVEVWRVEIDGKIYLTLSPEEALDAVMAASEKSSISILWLNVPQDFDPPGWEDRRPRLPPSATA
jgi:hypothetical protein